MPKKKVPGLAKGLHQRRYRPDRSRVEAAGAGGRRPGYRCRHSDRQARGRHLPAQCQAGGRERRARGSRAPGLAYGHPFPERDQHTGRGRHGLAGSPRQAELCRRAGVQNVVDVTRPISCYHHPVV